LSNLSGSWGTAYRTVLRSCQLSEIDLYCEGEYIVQPGSAREAAACLATGCRTASAAPAAAVSCA